jgi:hypothetical protein
MTAKTRNGEIIETDFVLSNEQFLTKYRNIFGDQLIANMLDLEHYLSVKKEDANFKQIVGQNPNTGEPIYSDVNKLIISMCEGIKNCRHYLKLIDLVESNLMADGGNSYSTEEIDIVIESNKKPAIQIALPNEGFKPDQVVVE